MVDDTPISGAENVESREDSAAGNTAEPNVDPGTKKFVTSWTDRIKAALKHHKPAFDRMDSSMQLAKDGGMKDWISNADNYVVPILNRITNQSVSQLYARNPTALAKRKRRRMHTVWDGTLASLDEAAKSVAQSMQAAAMPPVLMPGSPPPPPPQPPDPNAIAVIQDAQKVKEYDKMMDGVADTLTLLFEHFMSDQEAMYKQQFKSLVRRAKVCSVGYVVLSFQRILEKKPDITTKIVETTERMETLRALLAKASREELPNESSEEEQLKTLLSDLQAQESAIVKEGPLWSFPKSKRLIIDPACVHLKTLLGANWVVEEFEMTPTEIEETWHINIGKNFTEYAVDKDNKNKQRWSDKDHAVTRENTARVWRVMNRKAMQEFVICEGYPGYIKAPAAPETKLRRFYNVFPLVLGEIEDDDDLYAPSEVWAARHMQSEYNRSREHLREHRKMNRPAYLAASGAFEKEDLKKLSSHDLGEIIELAGMTSDMKISDKIQAKPTMQIDPKQYEVDSIWGDVQRVTGVQQANVGPTADTTATESSIAEQSRQVPISSDVDDIDDLLSSLFQATAELMINEMTKDTVVSIVGPGAVWPDMPESRQSIVEQLTLDVKGGSSGRPNKQQDLASMERAMPTILQLPGVNPVPIAERYLELFDMDIEDTIVEGVPSIMAINAMMGKVAGQGAAGPSNPEMQGGNGGNNGQKGQGTTPGAQPAMPSGIVKFDKKGNPTQ